jgi:hypothetical protein
MFLYVLLGAAAFVDGFAGGVFVGRKWVSKAALTAAIEQAASRATTMPAGGLSAVATEVSDDVKAVANKVTDVVSAVNPAIAAVTTGAADLQALLAAAHVTK